MQVLAELRSQLEDRWRENLLPDPFRLLAESSSLRPCGTAMPPCWLMTGRCGQSLDTAHHPSLSGDPICRAGSGDSPFLRCSEALTLLRKCQSLLKSHPSGSDSLGIISLCKDQLTGDLVLFCLVSTFGIRLF